MENVIGLCLAHLDPISLELIRGVRSYLIHHRLDWDFRAITEPRTTLANDPWSAHDGEFCGIIARGTNDWSAWARASRLPLVTLAADLPEPGHREVAIRLDDDLAGALGARFAQEQGFQDVAFIDPLHGGVRTRRGQSFLDHARDLGLRTHCHRVPHIPQANERSIEEHRIAWIRQLPSAPLIFFHQDRAATWFIEHAQVLGLRLPEEASILGVDNSAACETVAPALSSIMVPHHYMGELAAMHLHRLMCGASIDEQVHLVRPLRVAERDSVAQPQTNAPLLTRALDMMEPDKGTVLSIAEVARRLQMSPSSLTRLFKQYTGATPKAVQLRIRLQHAEHLLLTTDAHITQIASESGFASRVRFTIAFKERHGIGPKEFRRRSITPANRTTSVNSER